MVRGCLYAGYTLVIRWLYAGYTLAIRWLYAGYTLVIRWLYPEYELSYNVTLDHVTSFYACDLAVAVLKVR